ncbi:hypothetical protein OQA88_13654 [Cercophora sp. LCS_1]
MCILSITNHRCGHTRRTWSHCDKSIIKDIIVIRHIQTQPSPSVASSSKPANSNAAGPSNNTVSTPSGSSNTHQRRFSLSSSPSGSPTRARHRAHSTTFDPQNRSIKRLLRREHIPCDRQRVFKTRDETLVCAREDCHYERTRRVWLCCQCEGGPNREATCDGKKGVRAKVCKHVVCEGCVAYEFPPIPVYDPTIKDWTATPSSSPKSLKSPKTPESPKGKERDDVVMAIEDVKEEMRIEL